MVSKLNKLIETYHTLECEFNLEKSIEVCKEILEIDPDLIEFRENLACNYFNMEKYRKSIDLFEKCIEEGGDRETSIFMISLAYVKMNEREKALEYASKAGNEADYLLNHLRIHEELHEYDEAIEYGDRLLELNPEHGLALHIMSSIYDEINDYERSIFYLTELSKQSPVFNSMIIIKLYSLERYSELIQVFEENRDALINQGELESESLNWILGKSYHELERPYDALKHILESDRLKEDIEKKRKIAEIYMSINEFDNAKRYLLDGLKLDPLDENCLFLLSENSFYRGELLESVKWANKLLENHPNNAIFHVLGVVYLELGEIEKAFDYRKLGTDLMLENHDYQGDYFLIMANRLSKAGLHLRALNIYNTLLKVNPKFFIVYLERAHLHKRMGNNGLAEKDFKAYNDLSLEHRRDIDLISEKYKYYI